MLMKLNDWLKSFQNGTARNRYRRTSRNRRAVRYESNIAVRQFENLEDRCLLSGYELYVDDAMTQPGLVGSYVNERLHYVSGHDDWRISQTITGTRVDPEIDLSFGGFGDLASLGITGGTEANRDNFSIQWDGYIRILEDNTRLWLLSDDGARFWIDRNNDGVFNSSGAEFIDNNWGFGQPEAEGPRSEQLNAGLYRIRIQYEESAGSQRIALRSDQLHDIDPFEHYELFVDQGLTQSGILGSFVNASLKDVDSHDDWRTTQVISGTRVDETLNFESFDWGSQAEVGLTGGYGRNWERFSVQWDGYIRILTDGTQLWTVADDGNRFWIDINHDGQFNSSGPEFINNNWGSVQLANRGPSTVPLDAGVYKIRIQHEDGRGTTTWGSNVMQLKSRLHSVDLGDAPDTSFGTGTGDYSTLESNNGPRHLIDPDLFLGAGVDPDNGLLQNITANADDVDSALPDDEDGVLNPLDLQGTVGAQPRVTLLATNNTGSEATLYGWIDYNQDGVFDNETERVSISVPDGTIGERFTLTFPTIPDGSSGRTYARFRLSTDEAGQNSIGVVSDGEVEDYQFSIVLPTSGYVDSHLKIANNTNGGPPLTDFDSFATSVTSLGDLDGDGVTDAVVGTFEDDTGGADRGAVYVLLLNSNGSAKSTIKIAHNFNGGPALSNGDGFGISTSSIGDLDGDGITDLAVGAYEDDTGGTGRGAVYVLLMNTNGTVKGSTKIAHNLNGGPSLTNEDAFGAGVSSIGDLDGDGVIDLVVGANGNDTGGASHGAIYVLFMNSDGTVKSSSLIADSTNGGPVLTDFAHFGRSIASLGDIDGDSVQDLAVGANHDDTGGAQKGAVFVLHMQPNGTAKSSVKIAHNTNGGPSLTNNDSFGVSVAPVGDLDGDGINDLAVGANGDDTGGPSHGAVYVLLLNSDGTAKEYAKIANGTNGGPSLGDYGHFGRSVSLGGDFNGDGVADWLVGANHDDTGGNSRGALHVLFMDELDPTGTPPTITTGNDQVFSDNQFGLDWDAVPGAEGYEVWYTYATTGASPFIQQTVVSNSFTPGTPLPIGRYFIWVRVKQNDGSTSAWSTPITATVSVPAVLDPIEFLQTDLTPEFSWTAIPGATRYEIWGNNVTTGTSQIITDTNVTATSFTQGSDLPFGRYLVWVRGYDAANVPSAWSAPIEFSIGPQPVAPLGPTFDTTPTFEWTTITGAATYGLYLQTTSGIVVQNGLTGTTWTPAAPLSNGILRWWVRGYSGGGTPGAWSDRVDIDIGGRPVMQTPTGTGSDASPEFTWTAVAGATLYDLYVSRLDVPGLAFREDSLTTNSFDARILPDGDYRVWVRAFDGTSFGPWSVPINFTVDADSVALTVNPTSPLVATFDTTPTFTWTSDPGAASWDFFLSNGSTVIEQTGLLSTSFTVGSPLATGDWTWWVRAKDGSDNAGPWNAPTALHIGGRTVILAPTGSTVDNTPVFQWAAVQGAGRYILHVETSGGTVVIREDNLVGTSYEAPAPMAAGNYRFWVKAINAADNVSGFWSEPTDFTIVNTDQFLVPDSDGNNDEDGEASRDALLANLLQVPLADHTAAVRFNPPTVLTQLSPQSKPELNPQPESQPVRLDAPYAPMIAEGDKQAPSHKVPAGRRDLSDETNLPNHKHLDQLMTEQLQLLNGV